MVEKNQEPPTEQPAACPNLILLTKFHFTAKKMAIRDPNRLFVRAQSPETLPARDLATRG